MNHIFGLYTLQYWHIMNKSKAVCYSPSWEYSEYWIISSWVSTSHIESEVCVPTREKNMRLVCCLIWLLPKALAAAVEKIRILKSGAWTLFWLKNALELENLRSLEKTQKGCWLAQTQNKSHEFFSNIFGKTAYFQQFIKGWFFEEYWGGWKVRYIVN